MVSYALSTTYILTCALRGRDSGSIADVVAIVLPPIPTGHLTAADVEELTRSTREKMLKELVALTESPMGQKATKAFVEAGEEDLARRATPTAMMASGRER